MSKKASLPLDALWLLLKKIPQGKVSTYKVLANKLKLSNPRNVGWMLKQNTKAPVIPCHRVIQSSGYIGGYNGNSTGPEVKRKLKLLMQEGVRFNSKGKIEDSRLILKNI